MKQLGRKFLYGMATSLLVLIVGIVAAFMPALMTQLPVIIGGLLGSFTIYVGGNLGDTHLSKPTVTKVA